MHKSRRRLDRTILKFLPEKLRLAFIRRFIHLELAWPSPSLVIKVAQTHEELCAAFKLAHDNYVGQSYMDAQPSGMRVLPQHLLPQTTVVIAKWDEEVVGTVSLVHDNPFGLPMEKAFCLESLRKNGDSLAEYSTFAIHPKYRQDANWILFPILRFAFQYSCHCSSTSQVVALVNPSMIDMYLAFMCVEKLVARPIVDPDYVKGAEGVPFCLHVKGVQQKLKKVFKNAPDSRNFYKYWTHVPQALGNFFPPSTSYQGVSSIMTPALLKDLFLDQAQMAQRLTYQEIRTLLKAYPDAKFQSILTDLIESLTRDSLSRENTTAEPLLSSAA